MRKTFLLLATMLGLGCAMAQEKAMNEFVSDLMSRMTLKEKIGQLNLQVAGDITTGSAMDTEVGAAIASGDLGGVFNIKGADKIRALQQLAVEKSRLGIPLIIGMDVVHGYETIFPIPLGMSCSWNIEGVEQSAHIAAKEASADGICWTYSPMVDICVDARWGRTMEGNGEDPWLGGQMAAAYVRGYQGDYSSTENIMSCVKHFALYGAAEAGRDYNTVDMSRLRMMNQYLPPYKAAAEAGASSFMSSFNIVDGVPATANRWLLTDLLRNKWNYDGFVVTDYGSIQEMLKHGVGEDLADASAQALKAGTDMDMCSLGFLNTLEQSVLDNRISMSDIDAAVRRVLEAKYKLGLFKDPYRFCDTERRARDIYNKENRKAARDMAAESFVLLKNKGNILPLEKTGTVALVGPLANTRANMAGSWCVAYTPDRYSTLKEAMERTLKGKARLLYAQGCNVCRDAAEQEAGAFGKAIPRVDDAKAKAEAVEMARQADVIVCAMGESAEMSGESSSRANIELPDCQRELLVELVKLGKPVVMLNFSGRATVLKWENDNVDALMNVWFGGSEAADAICDVLFGDKAPCGHLTVTLPQHQGQVPIYYNHLNTGRPVPEAADRYYKYQSNYIDVRNAPLFPFGYGLTYTTFEYSPVQLSSTELTQDGTITASVTVTNTGNREATDVAQLYIHDVAASVSRPVKELKGFDRFTLKPGESREVSFTIDKSMLSFLNAEGDEVLEPGKFEIWIAEDSRSGKPVTFTLKPGYSKRQRVLFETTEGNITIELYNETPKHRDNFLKLVETHFYDSLLFHRIIPGFMIQTGDAGSKNAEPGILLGDTPEPYTIPAEIVYPQFEHKKGAIGAAREPDDVNPKWASSMSQFYITIGRASHLNGKYTVFGEVIDGMKVAEKIQHKQRDPNDRPLRDVRILKATRCE